MTLHIHFRCPCCHGSQYRTSHFDVSAQNPFGAKCIFCKSPMVTLDTLTAQNRVMQISGQIHN
ncbi:cold-shock protein [Atlantibacter hermannii]|uniref:cold shock small protein YmcF n=1 Tax=Atlantibacter hermannii TaxID=565 RepID=UPI0013776F82|nr:cold-shock protein [Atlantibacter hermannii]NBD00840.1 cold-shock protein [Atlantibacter hermannii]